MAQLSKEQKAAGLYRFVWRWHFFAGLFFAPLLILLSITGLIYLYKPYVEPAMHKNLYYVNASEKAELSATKQLEAVKTAYPDASLTDYTNPKGKERATEIHMSLHGVNYLVFVNPYTADVLGKLNSDKMLMQQIINLHGSIMAGDNTWGDWLIELSASWAVILLITGLYLYWPRNKQSWLSVLRIRWNSGSRTRWRDMHAFTAFWMTLVILMLVLTGLPWAGFFGKQLDRVVQWTHTQYYDWAPWDGSAQSNLKMKDVAKTAWAAEKLPVPESVYTNKGMLSIESIIEVAKKENVNEGYTITFPWDKTGVYVISTWGWAAESYINYATLGVDQYSGDVLSAIRWDDYSPLVKTVETGIALHEGRYFGWPNMILNSLACIALVFITLSGIVMWWLRRPEKQFGVPAKFEGYRLSVGVILLTIILGVLMPLAGISIALVYVLDQLIRLIRRVLKKPL